MIIQWHGGSSVDLSLKYSKALLNPSSKSLSIDKDVRLLVFDETDEKHSSPEEVLMVDWPGEYDVSGFVFKGSEVQAKNGSSVVYSFRFPEGNVAWMGNLNEYPSESCIEALGEVHLLLVPIGGGNVLDAKVAFRLVEELEPLVVIPICFDSSGDGLMRFLKEMDVKRPDTVKSYDFRRSSLNQEVMELVILEDLSLS